MRFSTHSENASHYRRSVVDQRVRKDWSFVIIEFSSSSNLRSAFYERIHTREKLRELENFYTLNKFSRNMLCSSHVHQMSYCQNGERSLLLMNEQILSNNPTYFGAFPFHSQRFKCE